MPQINTHYVSGPMDELVYEAAEAAGLPDLVVAGFDGEALAWRWNVARAAIQEARDILLRIAEPLKSVVNVVDFAGALQGIATTTLRAVIGDILLDDVLSKRDEINQVLRVKLDEQTERWGGKVTTVEIREIIPPRDVQEAMNRMLSAERNRRAVITESEGTRQSTINVAEGDKQSQILRAEGERQAAILRAEGFALALGTVFNVAQTVDSKTMTLQYLDALRALGSSPATKFVLPMEFTNLLRPLVELTTPAAPAARSANGS